LILIHSPIAVTTIFLVPPRLRFYRSAVAKMGDKFLISLSAENRKNANVKGGEKLEVTIELDTTPRTVELPIDLQKALMKNKTAKGNFKN
jgi:hypothetical protein